MAKVDETIVIKGGKGGLLVRLDDEGDFDHLKAKLATRLAASRNFFTGSGVIVEVGRRVLTTQQLLELEALFYSRFGVRVIQVVHSEEEEASMAGWGEGRGGQGPRVIDTLSEWASQSEALAVESRLAQATALTAVPGTHAPEAPHPQGTGPASGHPAGGQGESAPDETLLIRRTLRSGQHVRYNGNVVVLGDVNPGAQIVASGDIVVMGSLRGVAHAGATGNESAVVAALRLCPTQLRIAKQISRPPDEGSAPAAPPSGPEVASIRDGRIVIDTYQLSS